MFASFEIRPEGLRETEPRAKLVRSDDGCWPCRRKRKKCDKTRPACLRCRNSTKRDVCVWRESKKQPAHLSDSDLDELELPLETLAGLDLRSGLSPFSLPETVTNISPELTISKLLPVMLAYQRKVFCTDSDFADSLFLIGQRETNCNPALTHTWIACSLSTIAPETPYWQRKALAHHVQALSDLRKAITEEQKLSEPERWDSEAVAEWKPATVLLLHMFEVSPLENTLATGSGRSNLATAHLNAADYIFGNLVRGGYPQTMNECILFEAYTLRTAQNALFYPRNKFPLDYVSNMQRHLATALGRLGLPMNLRTCSWTGSITQRLVNEVYRLSWLAHRLPLRDHDAEEALSVKRRLEAWHCPDFDQEGVREAAARDAYKIATSFWHACRSLCTLLLSTLPGGTAGSFSAHEVYYREGINLVEEVSKQEVLKPILIWPLVVLGFQAPSEAEMDRCEDIARRVSVTAGKETAARGISGIKAVYALREERGADMTAREMMRVVQSQQIFM